MDWPGASGFGLQSNTTGNKQAVAQKVLWLESKPLREAERVSEGDRARFAEAAESEVLALHEGNLARYQVTPSQFAAWQEVWNTKTVVGLRRSKARAALRYGAALSCKQRAASRLGRSASIPAAREQPSLPRVVSGGAPGSHQKAATTGCFSSRPPFRVKGGSESRPAPVSSWFDAARHRAEVPLETNDVHEPWGPQPLSQPNLGQSR